MSVVWKRRTKTCTTVIGTLLIINQTCNKCDGSFKWLRQPFIGSTPAGNLLLSASILFSGALPSKVLRVLQFWGVQSITRQTFFRHQKLYLNPAICTVWKTSQDGLLGSIRTGVVCGGDARCDSMGHSAKYGSYTFVDLQRKKILAMELVQVNNGRCSSGIFVFAMFNSFAIS